MQRGGGEEKGGGGVWVAPGNILMRVAVIFLPFFASFFLSGSSGAIKRSPNAMKGLRPSVLAMLVNRGYPG